MKNQLAQTKAQLAQAEAQLVNAKNNLSYTSVTSPSDGIVGTIPYRVGSLVSPSMATPLTTVADISEMFAYFLATEKDNPIADTRVAASRKSWQRCLRYSCS